MAQKGRQHSKNLFLHDKCTAARFLVLVLFPGTAASSSYNEIAFIQTQASSIVFRCVVYPEPVLAQWPFRFSKTSVVASTTDDFELKDAQAAKDELDKHNTNAQSTQQDHDDTPARMRYARYVRATLNRADKRHHGTTNAAVAKQKRACLLFVLTGRPEVVLANNCPDVRLRPGCLILRCCCSVLSLLGARVELRQSSYHYEHQHLPGGAREGPESPKEDAHWGHLEKAQVRRLARCLNGLSQTSRKLII